MTKLTDTFPTPSTSEKPLSTADVQAPHVIPSTFKVVVAICATGALLLAIAPDVSFLVSQPS